MKSIAFAGATASGSGCCCPCKNRTSHMRLANIPAGWDPCGWRGVRRWRETLAPWPASARYGEFRRDRWGPAISTKAYNGRYQTKQSISAGEAAVLHTIDKKGW